jgi:hypothetical protein
MIKIRDIEKAVSDLPKKDLTTSRLSLTGFYMFLVLRPA